MRGYSMDSVALGLQDEHLRHCVVGAVAAGDGDDGQAKLTEATRRSGRRAGKGPRSRGPTPTAGGCSVRGLITPTAAS